MRQVDIGENRQIGLRTNGAQQFESAGQPRTSLRPPARTVRLIERRLEDHRDRVPIGHLGEMRRHAQVQIVVLQDARTRDQE